MAIIMTLWIGNGAVFKSFGPWMAIKRILKINNSWTELFNIQNSFNPFPNDRF